MRGCCAERRGGAGSLHATALVVPRAYWLAAGWVRVWYPSAITIKEDVAIRYVLLVFTLLALGIVLLTVTAPSKD